MQTNQIMKRNFMGSDISQRTKDSYFNATELLALANKNSETQKRFFDFWENNSTKSFIEELNADILNNDNCRYLENTSSALSIMHNKPFQTSRGKNGATWMHPYLFVKFAMWLSPKFELQIIKWVYDNLIEFRNQAGDHYNEMCSTISERYYQYYHEKPNPLIYAKEINYLNSLVYGVSKGGRRNELNEQELDLLNKLQLLNISLIKSNKYALNERREKLAEFACFQTLITNQTNTKTA